jgi:hypothetical protein
MIASIAVLSAYNRFSVAPFSGTREKRVGRFVRRPA